MRCFLIESDNNKVNPTKLMISSTSYPHGFFDCIIDVTPSSGPSIASPFQVSGHEGVL